MRRLQVFALWFNLFPMDAACTGMSLVAETASQERNSLMPVQPEAQALSAVKGCCTIQHDIFCKLFACL